MKRRSEYTSSMPRRSRQELRNPSDIRYVAGILAGGRSRRMGRPKALLPLPDGRTIIEKTVQVATDVSPTPKDVVILGQGCALPASLGHLTILPDEHVNAGPLAGLASLLHFAGEHWALLLACDLPGLDGACVTKLLAHAHDDADAVVFRRDHGHAFHPCCALYHPRILPVVRDELARGTGSIHHVLSAVRLCPLQAEAGLMRHLDNINVPADYERFYAEESIHTMSTHSQDSDAITVKLFGPIARQLGTNELRVSPGEPRPTGRKVLASLAAAEPRLQPVLKSLRLAVNHCFADDDQVVSSTDEVALIGMVSGG